MSTFSPSQKYVKYVVFVKRIVLSFINFRRTSSVFENEMDINCVSVLKTVSLFSVTVYSAIYYFDL